MLQGRTEAMVVAENTCRVLTRNRLRLVAGRRGVGAVDHGATERCHVHISVAYFQHNPVLHGSENVAGESLWVVVGEHYGMHGWIPIQITVRCIGRHDTTFLHGTIDFFRENGDGAVVDIDE